MDGVRNCQVGLGKQSEYYWSGKKDEKPKTILLTLLLVNYFRP
jgi:hypothetical protein